MHGVVTIRPTPPHCGHVPVRTNSPKTLRETCWTRPMPLHVVHVTGLVPGSAPLPLQRSQGTLTWKGTSRFTPLAASTSSISTSAAMSAPRARLVPPPPNRSSPKNAEKMSERLPKSNAPGVKPPPRRPAWP